MFKFMKSKKGFSLVELMIVVVIMAILVAVAVPIFNSVTGNSRAKTCIDNQRSIISTLNTALLEKTVKVGTDQTFYVVNYAKSGNTAAVKGYYKEVPDLAQNATKVAGGSPLGNEAEDCPYFTTDELKKLFQAPPYCPVDDSAIKVEIKPVASGDSTVANITTTCMLLGGDGTNPHALS